LNSNPPTWRQAAPLAGIIIKVSSSSIDRLWVQLDAGSNLGLQPRPSLGGCTADHTHSMAPVTKPCTITILADADADANATAAAAGGLAGSCAWCWWALHAAHIVGKQSYLVMVAQQVSALGPIKGWGCWVVQQHVHTLGQFRCQLDVNGHVPMTLAGQPQNLAGSDSIWHSDHLGFDNLGEQTGGL
jgi:hypothetical protein